MDFNCFNCFLSVWRLEIGFAVNAEPFWPVLMLFSLQNALKRPSKFWNFQFCRGMISAPSVESHRFDPPPLHISDPYQGGGQTYGVGAPRHLTCSEAYFWARRRREKNWLFSTVFEGKISILQGKIAIFFRACGGLKTHFYTVNSAACENFQKIAL